MTIGRRPLPANRSVDNRGHADRQRARRRWARSAAVALRVVLLVGTLGSAISALPTLAEESNAGDWASPTPSAPAVTSPGTDSPLSDPSPTDAPPPPPAPAPSEPAPTIPAPTPTPIPTPTVALAAAGTCTPEGGVAGWLTVAVALAPATLTDLRVVVDPAVAPEPLPIAVALPAVLPPGETNWHWRLAPRADATNGLTPAAILVRVAELRGTEAANLVARDGRTGWLLAGAVLDGAPCRPPATPEPTTTPAASEPPTAPATSDQAAAPAPPDQETSEATTPSGPSPDSTPVETAQPESPPASVATPTEPSDSPTPSPTPEANPVAVEALTEHHAVIPGTTVALRFRLTHTGETATMVRLIVHNSLPGWTAAVYDTDGITPLGDAVTIPAGADREVIVAVTAPPEAYVTDRNTTTLTALAIDPPTSAPTT